MRRKTLLVRCLAALAAVSLLGAGCTSKGGGEKKTKTGAGGGVATEVKKRSVTLAALYYAQGPDGPRGGFSEITIAVEPTDQPKIKVGFLEDEVGGSGPQWRASGWEATAVALMLTGIDPSKKEITFEITGQADGPSAGCLTTVGVLAALRGDTVKKNVTMTGTINPDGTVGPVGGIPYKVQGAKEAKKTLMLIPAGQMQSADETGAMVDVADIGDKEGIRVREVKDVYQAYKEFTGKTLPRPEGGEGVEVPKKVADRLEKIVGKWLGTYEKSKNEFGTLSPQIQELLAGQMQEADASAEAAGALLEQGLPAGAYREAAQAAVFVTGAFQAGRALEVYFTQGAEALKAQLEANAGAEKTVDALIDKLKDTKPKNLTDVSALMDAYGVATDAVSALLYAEEALNKDVTSQEDVIAALVLSSFFYSFAELATEASQDSLDVLDGLGGRKPAKGVDLSVIADFFRKAAEANMNLFTTVVVEEIAKSEGVATEGVQAVLADKDFDYGLALKSQQVQQGLKEYFGEGDALDYATLGSAVSLFSRSSTLLAKYYSLDAQLDDNFDVTDVGRPKAFTVMLDFADDQLQRAIGVLEAGGVEASLPVFYYETAKIDREGTPDDKFSALGDFWLGFVQARVLTFLGGFSGAGLG